MAHKDLHPFEGLEEICDSSLLTWIQLFTQWLISERGLSAHTVRNYLNDLKQALFFYREHFSYKLNLQDFLALTPRDFRSFLTYRISCGISQKSNARLLSTLRTFSKFLSQKQVANFNNIHLIRTPKIPRYLPRPLTKNQALSLATFEAKTWVDQRNKALFNLLYGSGLRISEALSLNQKDIPKVWMPLTVVRIQGKGNKERVVPLLYQVYQEIKAYLRICPFAQKPEAPLFWGQRGERLHPSVVRKKMADLRFPLGLPAKATPHSFRHSFASHLIGEGAELRHVQELLGHTSLRSTQVYTHVDAQHILKIYDKAHPRKAK